MVRAVRVALDIINGALIIIVLGLSCLLIWHVCINPKHRFDSRLHRELRLGKHYATRGRLVHADTHARRYHILSDIIQKNGTHFNSDSKQ